MKKLIVTTLGLTCFGIAQADAIQLTLAPGSETHSSAFDGTSLSVREDFFPTGDSFFEVISAIAGTSEVRGTWDLANSVSEAVLSGTTTISGFGTVFGAFNFILGEPVAYSIDGSFLVGSGFGYMEGRLLKGFYTGFSTQYIYNDFDLAIGSGLIELDRAEFAVGEPSGVLVPGEYQFAFWSQGFPTQGEGAFSFTLRSAATRVPESGSTLAMLGLGMCLLGLAFRNEKISRQDKQTKTCH